MRRSGLRLLGYVVLWHATFAGPNCGNESRPRVTVGEACVEARCAEADYCTAESVCAPRRLLGEVCDDGTAACVDNARCDTGLAVAVCVAAGEVSTGGQCWGPSDCANGTCRTPAEAAPRVCLDPLAEGAACNPRDRAPCSDDRNCFADVEGAEPTCHGPQPRGQPCGLPRHCGGDLVCVNRPDDPPACWRALELGDPCEAEADVECGFRAICRDGLCARSRLGERCYQDWGCEDGAYCAVEVPAEGECRDRKEAGAACESTIECAAGLGCQRDVCVE